MNKIVSLLALWAAGNAVYTPERGDDWTLLKPETIGEGISTVEFNFGIVVSLIDEEEPTNVDAFQIGDGQVQRRPNVLEQTEITEDETSQVKAVSCVTDSTLLMTLRGGILRDSSNRIGTIVGNRQFQFDGPTPQYGTIYANGWSIDAYGNLMLGDDAVFYQCSSGEFYNLYDESIDPECTAVNLRTVALIEC